METVESCRSLGHGFSGTFPSRLAHSDPAGMCHKRPCSVSRIHAGRPGGSQGRTALKDSFARSVLPHQRRNSTKAAAHVRCSTFLGSLADRDFSMCLSAPKPSEFGVAYSG